MLKKGWRQKVAEGLVGKCAECQRHDLAAHDKRLCTVCGCCDRCGCSLACVLCRTRMEKVGSRTGRLDREPAMVEPGDPFELEQRLTAVGEKLRRVEADLHDWLDAYNDSYPGAEAIIRIYERHFGEWGP